MASGFIFTILTHKKIRQTQAKQTSQHTAWQHLQEYEPALDKNSLATLQLHIATSRDNYIHHLQIVSALETAKTIHKGQPSNALGIYFSIKNLQSDLLQLAEKINREATLSQASHIVV